jgi:hypothetical protein
MCRTPGAHTFDPSWMWIESAAPSNSGRKSSRGSVGVTGNRIRGRYHMTHRSISPAYPVFDSDPRIPRNRHEKRAEERPSLIPPVVPHCRRRVTCDVSDRSCEREAGNRERKVLTLFPVEHTSALDRAVVKYLFVEVPSTGRSNCPGGAV